MAPHSAPAVDLMVAGRPRVAPIHGHDWRLRDVEFIDGLQARRFECDGCGGVTFR